MMYFITYQPSPDRPRMDCEKGPSDPQTLRWVAGSGQTPKAIIRDFEKRFAGVKVLSLKPATEAESLA